LKNDFLFLLKGDLNFFFQKKERHYAPLNFYFQ